MTTSSPQDNLGFIRNPDRIQAFAIKHSRARKFPKEDRKEMINFENFVPGSNNFPEAKLTRKLIPINSSAILEKFHNSLANKIVSCKRYTKPPEKNSTFSRPIQQISVFLCPSFAEVLWPRISRRGEDAATRGCGERGL